MQNTSAYEELSSSGKQLHEYYLTPNSTWFQSYFWIAIPSRVICPNLPAMILSLVKAAAEETRQSWTRHVWFFEATKNLKTIANNNNEISPNNTYHRCFLVSFFLSSNFLSFFCYLSLSLFHLNYCTVLQNCYSLYLCFHISFCSSLYIFILLSFHFSFLPFSHPKRWH